MKTLKPDNTCTCCQPDPYVIQENNRFFLYATHTQGISLYVSDDMRTWTYAGFALTAENEKEFWAPSVVKLDGRFYMYYSSVPAGEQDVHAECLKVAVSDTPEGPFSYRKTLLPPFSIDAHAVVYRGRPYLFYSRNKYEGERVGTYIVLDALTDPFTVEGRPREMLLPTIEQEVSWPSRDFGDGKPPVKWYTLEGACYFYESGVHYLMYSGSAYQNDKYFVGYATSRDDCEDLRDVRFVKYPDDRSFRPLLCKNDRREGTGHNSILLRDDGYYIFYHARKTNEPNDGAERRRLRINRLHVDDGVLTVGEEISNNLE